MLDDIHEATQGRWRGILSQFGMTQRELSGKHGACPICQEGVDRFRFDDKGGRGTWFCTHCGAGSGVDLVMKLRGWDFKGAVKEIRPLVGLAAAEKIKAGMSEADKRDLRIAVWKSSKPVIWGDAVDAYLTSRGVNQTDYPMALRFCADCRYSQDFSFPAMIAAVQDDMGQAVSLHRTFLKGDEKAPVDNPRMVMPGSLPNGCAVRLSPVTSIMGIAEGIETALAARNKFGIPTWAALNANLLAEWTPPNGVREVHIFGDNDASFTGQAAAYQLARRLARKKIKAIVHIPQEIETDWADKNAHPTTVLHGIKAATERTV